MARAHFGNLLGSMAVARPNFAQVFPRHAVQSVNSGGLGARFFQQVVERVPVVSPIEIKANALPQFLLVDFSAPPLVQNELVTRKYRFQPQPDRSISNLGALFKKRGSVILRCGQSVVVADQNDVSSLNGFIQMSRIENGVIRT